MDLNLSDDEQLLQTTVRQFIQREAPTAKLTSLQTEEPGFDKKWLSLMADAGWLGAVVPDEDGGIGASTLEAAVICEELGRGPLPGPFLSSSVVAALLLTATTPSDTRNELLSGIARGTAVIAPLLPGLSTQFPGDLARAVATSVDGGYRLDGDASYVPYASSATHLLLPIADDPNGAAVKLAVVAVPQSGVGARLLSGLLAWNYQVSFSDVLVPPEQMLPVGSAQSLTRAMNRAYLLLAAYQVGGCQAVLDRSLEYSNSRKQFGQPIGSFQRVQDHIVEILNALDAARWSTFEAIWSLDTGRSEASKCHMAKAVASEAYVSCVDYAHKVHGGIGVDPQYGLTLYTQLSRSLYTYLGHPRWHKRKMLTDLACAQADHSDASLDE